MTNEGFSLPLHQCNSSSWYNEPEAQCSPRGSWVQSIAVTEQSSSSQKEIRGSEIHIRLLGQYQDGFIEFTYEGVQNYSLSGIRDVSGSGHWLEDDLKLTKHNRFVHKVTLTNGDFRIEAEEIEYKWTPLQSMPAPIAGESSSP